MERSSPPAEPVLTLEPSTVRRVLLAIVAVLVPFSIAGQALVVFTDDFPMRDAFANLFSVDVEQSLPTLYSTLMLVACAFFLALIARARVRMPYARYWLALSLIFVLLSVDEFASIHEQTTGRVQSLLDISSGVFLLAWVIPGIAICALFAIAFVPFLRGLPPATRRGFVLAGLLFVGGAIGIEIVGSAYVDAHGDAVGMPYALIVAVEEGLEMVGIVVFIHALLAYIAVHLPNAEWRLRVREGEPLE